MRGFYEDYKREKHSGDPQDRPAIVKRGAGAAVWWFITKLFTAVMYIAAMVLSSVGLTTLINKPLRDMLFELVRRTFFGN